MHPYIGLIGTYKGYKHPSIKEHYLNREPVTGIIAAVGQQGNSTSEGDSVDVVAFLLMPDGSHESYSLSVIVVDPKEAAARLGARTAEGA